VLITGKDGLERPRFFEVRSGRSYAAACDPRVRVGLGPEPPRSIRAIVRWPGPGHGVEEYPGILPGRVTELVESREGAAGRALAFPSAPGRAAGSAPDRSGAPAASTASATRPVSPAAADARRVAGALQHSRDLRASHRLAEALAALKEACAADASLASSREARVLEAELCFSLYRPAEAALLLESLGREDSADPAPRVLLARTLVELGRHGEAVKLFRVLIAEGTDLGGEGRRACARALIESNLSEEAVAQLAAALAADPWLDAAYLDYGRALHRLGRSDRAAPFLARYRSGEKARRIEEGALNLENQGRPAQAQYARGRAEVLHGRAFGALTYFNRALSLDPKDGTPLLALARLSARLERPADALARLTPFASDPAVAAVRSEIEEELGTGSPKKGTDRESDLDRARRSIRERMAGRPLSASIGELLELARVLAAAGEAARAREVALFAAEIAPREAAAQLAAAEIFEDPGEAFVRLWALDRAARATPGDEALRSRRAALARELGLAEAVGGRSGRP
jgi:Flp pilus assembly protein TadD